MYIDTHCHLSLENKEEIANLGQNLAIISGTSNKNNQEVINLIEKYSNLYGTIGIHPEELDDINDLSFIEKNISNKKIVAIGEIGLDYYYSKENIELQKEVFIKQLDLARKYKKNVVVHSRDAFLDTYNILKNYSDLKVTIHCFSYSLESAKMFIKLGFKIGITGVITFKNSANIKNVVENVDIYDMFFETDSPYLTPEPYRGQKNEPKNVEYVARKVAELKNIEYTNIINIVTKNACEFYGIRS